MEQPEQKQTKTSLFAILREWVGLFVALTGVFTVLLYMAGRSYAAGYFESMNIPHYQVSFSLWEYGEVGWLPMVLYPIIMFAAAGLFWGIVDFLLNWLVLLIKRLVDWLKKRILLPKFTLPVWAAKIVDWIRKTTKSIWAAIKPPPLSLFSRVSFLFPIISIITFSTILFASLTLEYVYKQGLDRGKSTVLEKSPQLELIAKDTLPIDESTVINPKSNSNGTYLYQGFHLLTSNNGKYYIFKEIDKTTCKPVKVYIVEDDPNIQVNLLPPVSLSNQCQN